ncbi:MAG: type II toxin-antitoxin system VapC family toxin [Opitutales bacterium]
MDAIVSIDTNVLVRFLVEDDPKQCAAAKGLFEKQLCFITESVLLEAEWVMRAVYEVDRKVIAAAYRALLRMETVLFPDAGIFRQVITCFEAGFDFADAMHLVRSEGYPMKTFDRDLMKQATAHGYKTSSPSGLD